MRQREFFNVVEMLEEVTNNILSIYQLLIKEGLELKRFHAPESERIFSMVFGFYEKIKEIT